DRLAIAEHEAQARLFRRRIADAEATRQALHAAGHMRPDETVALALARADGETGEVDRRQEATALRRAHLFTEASEARARGGRAEAALRASEGRLAAARSTWEGAQTRAAELADDERVRQLTEQTAPDPFALGPVLLERLVNELAGHEDRLLALAVAA